MEEYVSIEEELSILRREARLKEGRKNFLQDNYKNVYFDMKKVLSQSKDFDELKESFTELVMMIGDLVNMTDDFQTKHSYNIFKH